MRSIWPRGRPGPRCQRGRYKRSRVSELRARKNPAIKQLCLFGSRARGADTASSDFDFFAVFDLDHPVLVHQYLDAIELLETAAGRRIDLVVNGHWNYRDGILKSEIERDKVLIYDRDAQ
ncbi:nucleotidyltransferase family protein [Enorma massiliensis]|uniref:nucleotidyltransferase family protein n=1 Tax=Enorma massiliensis TaxID=1472761 RepID=UPI003A94A202